MTALEAYLLYYEDGGVNWVDNYPNLWIPHPKNGQLNKMTVHLVYFLQVGIWIDTYATPAPASMAEWRWWRWWRRAPMSGGGDFVFSVPALFLSLRPCLARPLTTLADERGSTHIPQ